MAKDERGAAASRLMQMIQAKKTGEAGQKPTATAKPVPTVSANAGKKPVASKVVLPKVVNTLRGAALIVDSNPRLAMTLQSSLKSLKFSAQIVGTGKEALEALETTPFDLVIVEMQLPDIAGFNLCSKLRVQAGERSMAIIITGEDNSPGMRDQAMMVDANDYMPKPVNLGELGTLLDTLVK